jgi:hypothetical protein
MCKWRQALLAWHGTAGLEHARVCKPCASELLITPHLVGVRRQVGVNSKAISTENTLFKSAQWRASVQPDAVRAVNKRPPYSPQDGKMNNRTRTEAVAGNKPSTSMSRVAPSWARFKNQEKDRLSTHG